MTADPDEVNIIITIVFVNFLNEGEVFDFAGAFAPAIFLPAGSPFSKSINPKLGISMDFAGFAISIFYSGKDSITFHADIGGIFSASGFYWYAGAVWLFFNDSVTARTWVWAGAAVCP